MRALAISDGQNALPGPAFDGENVLRGPVFDGGNASPSVVFDDVPPQNQQVLPQEGRAEDQNDLLGGEGNGSVVDPLPSTGPYPDVPWDLIEAFLMDDGDNEDQKPMNFSGVQEHQQPTTLSAAAPGGEWQDQASTSCNLADQYVISLQPMPLSAAAPEGEWQDQTSTSCECAEDVISLPPGEGG